MPLGSDISGAKDLNPSMAESTGQRALAEAVARRLTTDLGALPDYPEYGYNVETLIGSTASDLTIQQGVLGQAYLEEEIESAELDISRSGGAVSLKLSLVSGDGPFDLTLNVSSLGVDAIFPE